MVNCWKEAVAAELQLAVFHALEAANDPDSGAESGECRLNLHLISVSTSGRRVLGHDRGQK